jgi:hypothetical protein
MQKPIFFTHQNVKPSDLDFISTSYEGAIEDNFTVFSNNSAGLASGFGLSGTGGSSQFSVAPGVGYNDAGQRFEIFSPGSGVAITFTGTKTIYARLTQVNYDPNPATNPSGSSNVVKSLNPDTNTYVNTRSYDLCYIDTTGTSSDLVLGQVVASSGGQFVSANSSGSQHLTLVNGLIDVYNGEINASVFQSGSLDSNSFVNGLNYDIVLNTGTSIFSAGSGSSDLGSSTAPFANIYANTGTFHQINGMSPIIIDSLQMKTGTSIESTSGKLKLDNTGRGVQIGGQLQVTGISAGVVSGNLTLSTPSGNIVLTTSNGSVQASNVNVSNSLSVSGPVSLANGLTVTGPVDLTSTTLLLPTSQSNPENLIFNSDFSMGVPTFYTGVTIFNTADTSNFKSGLAILSPWDSRYSGTLTPYNWSYTGTNATVKMLVGTSQPNTDAVGVNEVQTLTTAISPTSGSFYIVYTGIPAAVWPTGAAVTGVTASIPYTVTYTGLQAELEALSNIGAGNVSVVGSWATGFQVTFSSGLGYRNLPLMSISGSTLSNPSGSTAEAFVETIAGYTPVYTAIKDETVFTDIPGLNHFARISGSTIQSNGSGIYFSTRADGLKPNTDYTVSLYYKNIAPTGTPVVSYYSTVLLAGLSNSELSAPTYVDMDLSPTSSGWQLVTATLTSPTPTNSYDPQYLVFRLEPTGVASSDVIASIAGVQLTEGTAGYQYSRSSSGQILSLIEPSGVYTAGGTTWTATANSTSSMTGVRPNSAATTAPLCSGSFFTPGGRVSINSNATVYSNTTKSVVAALLIDGVVVDTQMSALGSAGRSFSLNKSMYLPRGVHNVQVKMIQGDSSALNNATNYSAVATSATTPYSGTYAVGLQGATVVAPKIDIVFN